MLCAAGLAAADTTTDTTTDPVEGAGAATATASATQPSDAPPPAELDSDLVYAVLVAELAGRSGDMAMAFTHFLHAAQLARDPKMAELAVRAALAGEDADGAGRAVALWLTLEPDSVGAHQLAALLRIKAKDREGALTHLARVVELSGSDAGTGYTHAIGIVARAETESERVTLMQSLVELDADNPDAHYALAMVAAAAERAEVAEAAARRALELRPDWNKPRIFLVRLLLSEGKREQARTLLEDYVAAAPEDLALRMLYGQFLVEEKEFSSARTEFERLLSTQPKEPDVLFAVGILSLQLDDVDAARIYFTRLYQTGQRRNEAAYYLGQVEERAEHPAAALDWYAKAGGANETEAQVRIAVIQAKQGQVSRSREIIQRLRDQSPDNAESLYLVEAEILDQVGRQDDAMAVYDAALAAFPDNADLLYARAMYAVKRDRLDRAESDLRRIIAAEPDHADALNALGYTLADRSDRYQEARELIEKAHQLKPDEPAILDSMGWVNYRLGNFEAAIDYLRRALAIMKDGEIAAHLGEVLWAMGRHDEAWQVWDGALKDYPEHAYLLEVVGRHRVTKSESRP
ncbi:MAG: tetratricopeptide repeat protein [Chromatiaceae bacterium]